MSREEEIILELKFEDRKYQLVKVDFNGVYSLEIRGSKKGSFYMGGGITINSYHFWNNLKILLNIINEINIKEISEKDIDKKLSFFIYKSKIITAEIKFFNERFFLRIKSYQNYRINRGEIVYYKNLEIKQSGSGYYIQEFDFPLNDQWKKEIKILIEEIENSIFQLLLIKLNDNSNEIKDYIKNEQLISDSKLLWINNNEYIENILFKPFFDLICDKLSERPLDINDLY